MYKYLVVGCGGSGGATLAYLMDQITSELLPHGIDRIPAGLQFVHIDVPVAADTRQPGVGTVVEQGGSYLGTAPAAGRYPVLDHALTTKLGARGALEEIATWAPRDPDRITDPISDGAGQMRAVGRAILLTRTAAVRDGLARAVDALNTVEADGELSSLFQAMPSTGRYDQASGIVTIVVSSMAGGAGASMALDVCRLLADVPGIDPAKTAVFMVTPDTFGSIRENMGGTNGNALAMLGEIVAAQTGAAAAHDRAVLGALGERLDSSSRAPFARVFPVGRQSQETMFGDGTPTAVYRGLGRGLAALMLSGRASGDFVAFDLGNGSGVVADRSLFGWGTEPSQLAWGAFGFGSLSLGRDRYRHYAAQRIARTAIDRLLDGHLQPGSTALGSEQLRALLESQWPGIAPAAGLPRQTAPGLLSRDEFSAWVTEVMLPRDRVDQSVRSMVDTLIRPGLPQATGPGAQWLAPIRSFLAAQRGALAGATEEASMRWAYAWAQRLQASALAEVENAVARFGLAYARAVVERMQSTVTDLLVPQLEARSRVTGGDPAVVPAELEAEVGRIRGVVTNGQAIVERLLQLLSGSLSSAQYGRASGLAVQLLGSFVTDSLQPLADSLSETIRLTEQAADPAAAGRSAGAANVETDRYPMWPSEGDSRVPERFDVADNDILITPAAEFADRYSAHLRLQTTVAGVQPVFDDARQTAARWVISGDWPVAAGDVAPGGLLRTEAEWRAPLFLRDPETGESLVPSQARYAWALSTRDVLDRAMRFVRQRDGAFERYCSQSLASYVGAQDDRPARASRMRDVTEKFRQAVRRALPLINVHKDAVGALYGPEAYQYFFKFSTVPFAEEPDLVEALRAELQAMQYVSGAVWDPRGVFARAVSSDSTVSRIDVFGSYRNYAPVVFTGVLGPAKRQWEGLPAYGRRGFWADRRARPLAAALPMGDAERRAMIAGWYVGQLVGEVRIPEAPFVDAVTVWDDGAGQWLEFPVDLLTPPAEFVGKAFDWLPAVLESILVAMLRFDETPVFESTRPYRLLRGLFDDTSEQPASGMLEVSAVQRLGSWLTSGATRSGEPSRVQGETPQERLAAAKAWLAAIHDFAGRHYLRPGEDGAVGGGEFSVIATRQQASRTPMFHDLAPDIFAVTRDLQAVLDRAAAVRSAPAPSAPAEPEPGFGAF